MKKQNKQLLQVFIVSILIFFFSYFVLKSFFFSFNQDFLYILKNFTKDKVSNDLIVVEIDDVTYNTLGYPLDRKYYLQFLDNLKQAKPAVVGFDIFFADKSDNLTDLKLAQKFEELGNIVLGMDIKSGKAILPYSILEKSVKNIGYYKPILNKITQKVYSLNAFLDLVYKKQTNIYESFSFVILREYYNYIYGINNKNINTNIEDKEYDFFTDIRKNKIPVGQNSEFYINYLESNKFKKESFYNIYNGNFNKDLFKDKIVLIGYTAEGVKDEFLAPGVGNGGPIKGVYVHVNAINNILQNNYVMFFNEKIELLTGFLFILFVIYLNIFHLKHLNLKWISFGAIFLFVIILFLYLVIFTLTYDTTGIYLVPNHPYEFVSILFLSFFVSSILKYINEDKNKNLLSKALSEYVSSDIAKEILTSSGTVNLGGENKKITMFFSDIAGFTTISEKLSPEQLVSFLRVYLGEMSHIIMDNKGFINKYEGDAIMALWGVFGKVENYGVAEACNSCLLQQVKLKQLNDIWMQQGKSQLQVRMGLHTGNAIIGNIGAEGRKMEFTALGDSVNLASRLEGVNKFYGTNICVSEDIYNEVKDLYTFRYLDKIRVKGKNIPINIYELVSYKGKESDLQRQIISEFESAINIYLTKDFIKAKEAFEKLASLGDNPSKTYIKRCEIYITNPPPDDWDGVWNLDEK